MSAEGGQGHSNGAFEGVGQIAPVYPSQHRLKSSPPTADAPMSFPLPIGYGECVTPSTSPLCKGEKVGLGLFE